MKTAIDYRRTYTHYLIRCIQDKLEELSEINTMPEELLEKKMIKENINMEILKKERGVE